MIFFVNEFGLFMASDFGQNFQRNVKCWLMGEGSDRLIFQCPMNSAYRFLYRLERAVTTKLGTLLVIKANNPVVSA